MSPHDDGLHEQLLPRLRAWGRNNIHIGLSPRVSPLWNGLLCREPRGAIAEYARIFDTATVGFGPWRSPDAVMLARLNAQVPEGFGWTVVIEDEHMMYRFPYGYPDRRKRGEVNPYFLDPQHMRETVFPLLRLLEPHVRIVMLRLAPLHRTEGVRFEDFLHVLTRCVDALPATYCYGVEIGNREFILPEYLAFLHARNIAHVPPSMPVTQSLLDAIGLPGGLTAEICALRTPCVALEEEGEEWVGFREIVQRCLREGKTLYAYCSDGLDAVEGATEACIPYGAGIPRLIRLLAGLDRELAQRSPIKRKAA